MGGVVHAADALHHHATRLITCGGLQSNHARATAVVARRLGLRVTLVLREPAEGADLGREFSGNLLIDRLAGAEIRTVPFAQYRQPGSSYEPFLAEAAAAATARGERPYIIPEGGSGPLGCFGYISATEELLTTWQALETGTEFPDAVFLAVGSGGTLAGLHLGCERLGLDPARIRGVNVCNDAAYFQKRASRLMQETAHAYGLSHRQTSLHIHDGYVGLGYARATSVELRDYAAWFREEGVLMDPVYTGKAFRGMLGEIAKARGGLGRDILFVHTGGMFASFAMADEYAAALANQPLP